MLPPSLLVTSHGRGLIDLPLRASMDGDARRARLAGQASRATWGEPSDSHYLSLEEWPRMSFTARIERPLFHRGGSASKKGT
jgi:hypothetical protein